MTDEKGVEEQWWCEVDGQWYGTVNGGHVVDEPEEVKTEKAEAMRKQANERGGFMRALERVMKTAFGPSEAEEWTEEQHREWTDENITWKDFEEAVAKAKANKGMGVDGFNAYLLNTKLCPEGVRRHYCACLHAMIREREFPERFREWRCVLAMKKGEDPRVVHRRRDLWLVPHAQKNCGPHDRKGIRGDGES